MQGALILQDRICASNYLRVPNLTPTGEHELLHGPSNAPSPETCLEAAIEARWRSFVEARWLQKKQPKMLSTLYKVPRNENHVTPTYQHLPAHYIEVQTPM